MVFKLLASDINILPILKQVAENWGDFKGLSIAVQKEIMRINLINGVPLPRTGNEGKQTRLNNSDETIKTELYHKYTECVCFLDWFEKIYGGKIHRVTIAYLPADGKVYPHIDKGKYYENKDRFHLVLSGYYDYIVDGETQRFGAGDLFWFDNKKVHSSINATPIPRISLIFDAEGSMI